jgi:hypothetical protein
LAAPALKDTPKDQGIIGERVTVRSITSGWPIDGKV